MTTKEMDLKGLECPEPALKVGVAAEEMEEGDTIIAVADCPSFPDDIKEWCERMDKDLVSMTQPEEGVNRAEIQL